MNEDYGSTIPGNQTFFDVISGNAPIRVSVELRFETIMLIFIAFLLANVVGRVLIK